MADGRLVEINDEPKPLIQDDGKLWRKFLGIAANRNMTVMQARIMFNKQAGYYPPQSVSPSPEPVLWNMKVAKIYPQYRRGGKS